MGKSKDTVLDKFFSGDKQLPTVPVLYTKFTEMIENSVTSNKAIADLIMKDQAMVVKILRLSNSAMYARRQEIKDLTNAITFLGLETLKDLVLQISLVRAFPFAEGDIPGFSINTFWEHSLGTAYFANLMAKKLNIPANDNYYLGSLLHDIGKLVIYQFYPQRFKEIVLKQINKKLSDTAAEHAIFGINHADIGAYFAEKWEFKKEIVEAIKNHHKTSESMSLNVAIVRVANLFSKTAGLCFPWDSHVFDIVGDPTWEILSSYTKEDTDIQGLVAEIMGEANKIKESVKELLGENE